MEFINYITIGAFFVGFILGIIITSIFHHNKLPLSKAIALILFIVWLLLHVWGFYIQQQLPWVFDLMGAAACGGLIGIDTISLIRSFWNKDAK